MFQLGIAFPRRCLAWLLAFGMTSKSDTRCSYLQALVRMMLAFAFIIAVLPAQQWDDPSAGIGGPDLGSKWRKDWLRSAHMRSWHGYLGPNESGFFHIGFGVPGGVQLNHDLAEMVILEGSDYDFNDTHFVYRQDIEGGRKVRYQRVGDECCALTVWITDEQVAGIVAYAQDLTELAKVLQICDQARIRPPDDLVSKRDRENYGYWLNEMAIFHYYRSEFQRSLPWVKLAYLYSPDDVTIATNVADVLRNLGRLVEANQHMETIDSQKLGGYELCLHGDILYEMERYHLAAQSFRLAQNLGYRDDDAIRRHVYSHWFLDQEDETIRLSQEYYDSAPTAEVAVLVAEVLEGFGHDQRAVDFLRDSIGRWQRNVGLRYELLDILLAYERFEDMEVELVGAVKLIGEVDHSVYRGYMARDQGLYEEALVHLRMAYEKDPQRYDILDSIEYVERRIGKGGSRGIRSDLGIVELPEEVWAEARAIWQGVSEELMAEGRDAISEYRIVAYRWRPDYGMERTYYVKHHILTSTGAADYNEIRHRFVGANEEVMPGHCYVVDERGDVVGETSIGECYVEEWDGSYKDREMVIPLNGVAPGVTIVASYTIEDKYYDGNSDFYREFGSFYTSTAYVAVATNGFNDIVQVAHNGMYQHKTFGNWSLFTPDRKVDYRNEDKQAPLYYWTPRLCIGPSGKTWSEVGREYLEQIDHVLSPSDEVRGRYRDWIAGLKGDEDLLVGLYQRVQDELAYQQVDFGAYGRVPEFSSEVLDRSLGDCKDQSLVLHQLLKEAGFNAHLALVDYDNATQVEIPSLDQFNHMVVVVAVAGANGDSLVLLDPTNKAVSQADLVSPKYYGGSYLMLDPDEPRLLPITSRSSVDNNRVDVTSVFKVRDDWSVDVEEQAVLTGPIAISWRQTALGYDERERRQWLIDLLRYSFPDAQVADVSIDLEVAQGEQMRIGVSYTLPRAFHHYQGKLIGSVGSSWLRYFLVLDQIQERRSHFWIRDAFALDVSVHIDSAGAVSVDENGLIEQVIDGNYVRSHIVADKSGEGLWLKMGMELKPGIFPPEQWGDYRSGMDGIRMRFMPTLVLSVAD